MPKRFGFALRPLLERRTFFEEEKRRAFALRARERDRARAAVDRASSSLAIYAQRFRKAASRAEPLDPLVLDERVTFLGRALARRRVEIAECDEALIRARAELCAAATARRVLERLQERQRRRFEAEAARFEEHELDETNVKGT